MSRKPLIIVLLLVKEGRDGAKSALLFLEHSLSCMLIKVDSVSVASGSAEAENTSEATAVKFKKR